MAKLSSFSRNAKAMREGDWVNPGAEYGGLEIKTKAMMGDYNDLQASMIRLAARKAGGEEKIGSEDRFNINIEALIRRCLLDVRGLENDDGSKITFSEFCELIRKPEHGELALVAFNCAGMVGRTNAALVEEAEGNSLTASSTISNGLTTPTS